MLCSKRSRLWLAVASPCLFMAGGGACFAQPAGAPGYYNIRRYYTPGENVKTTTGREAYAHNYCSGLYVDAHGDTSHHPDDDQSSADARRSEACTDGVSWFHPEGDPPVYPVSVTYSGSAQASALAAAEVSDKDDTASGRGSSSFSTSVTWIDEEGEVVNDTITFSDDAAGIRCSAPDGGDWDPEGTDETGWQSFSHGVSSYGTTTVTVWVRASGESERDGTSSPNGGAGSASASATFSLDWEGE